MPSMEIPAEFQCFKVKSVAQALEVHPKTVRKLVKAGELQCVWLSQTDQRITGASLAAFLERRKVRPGEEKGGGKVAAGAGVSVTENVRSRASQVLERLGLRGAKG